MIEPDITQADMDLQQALWKMSVNWGNGEDMAEMIANHRSDAEKRVHDECAIEIARLRQALADIANGLSFLANPVDLALAQYMKDIRDMAKRALAIQPGGDA